MRVAGDVCVEATTIVDPLRSIGGSEEQSSRTVWNVKLLNLRGTSPTISDEEDLLELGRKSQEVSR